MKHIAPESFATLLMLIHCVSACDAAAEKTYISAGARNEIACQSFSTIGSAAMTTPVAESACAFAWRNYLLLHSCVSENDDRRTALRRYVSDLCEIGDYDFDHLQIAAVTYLKKLDELHSDQAARRAADQALIECLGGNRV